MGKVKTGFAYLFYYFYAYLNNFKENVFVYTKAIALVVIMELLLIFSVLIYYLDFYKIIANLDSNRLNMFFYILPIVGLNVWFFDHNKNGRRYIAEFEAWPEEKRKKWDMIMKGIIFFVVANLLLSFYFMATIDWKQYK